LLDSGSEVRDGKKSGSGIPDPHQSIFNQKTERSGMFIPDPGTEFFFHPGSRDKKSTGSRIRIRNIQDAFSAL